MSIRSAYLTGFSFISAVKALALAWQRRRMVGRLSALDDRLLADIGITRHDVLYALAEPLFVDPSEKLAERARDARRGRRAAAIDTRLLDAYDPAHRTAA